MKKICFRCGREGERGFWTAAMQYPQSPRSFCTNEEACLKRVKAKKVSR